MREERNTPVAIDDSVDTWKNSLFLALLAIQIGVQPVLMAWYAKEAANVPLRIVVINVMKIGLALAPLGISGSCRQEWSTWSFAVALRTTVLPACIYVVQDYLNQTAVIMLDGVTYNVLNQTKIIWTALLVYWMLGKKQSTIQVSALVLLVASAVLIAVGGRQTRQANYTDEIERVTGMTRACIAAVFSALAGTIIQKALQKEARNAYVVTIELAIISIFTNMWPILLSPAPPKRVFNGTATPTLLWDGWTTMTFLTLFIQACGGVLVGFVIKYSGNIKKSFAVVLGLLLTAVIESMWIGKEFGAPGYIATVCVMISTVLYTKYPPAPSTNGKRVFARDIIDSEADCAKDRIRSRNRTDLEVGTAIELPTIAVKVPTAAS
ncbi:Drug/Metabolite Transporter (DMT) Superfamily [Thraustotheca clavata]|uniref:Drug/Metabolite Transporter (DMT) Superfamily n=1 Tax=Thraustotheca clavata TaxID=74557 RepID=A0A1V9ZCJ0_9STRA|nr:Drug/Metabolite Transporter (DMT) Superfamily [Thraustotheca clavata]